MTEIEKILILGKMVQDLNNIVVQARNEEIWLKEDAFENAVRVFGVFNDICHKWYSNCNEQFFYYENIRFYTIYNDFQDGFVPKPEPSEDVWLKAKEEVENNDLV